ncbi:MAG: carboxylating nicotinate-nucleotide diphosphorylase [Elusimicrobiota bacterium]|jgi:nicotinate-nucleotide pyrophosphorylase (carboxylating)|nr:carboxylating nicotinate-nucleotide diphosphorylase [Elusimicrobiota bacterium]
MNIDSLIKTALEEDGAFNDITTKYFVDKNKKAKAILIGKGAGILCGIEIFERVFKTLDNECSFKLNKKDGAAVKVGETILEIKGRADALLSAERTALNFVQHLSGIATAANEFVKLSGKSKAKIFDTRKTIPLYRELAKYAVRCGGAKNHRIGLSDMALIKDNHLKLIKDLKEAVLSFRKNHKNILVEIECENLEEIKKALQARADIIMLDNMSFERTKKAIRFIRENSNNNYKPEIEISGRVNLETIKKLYSLDVERISVGMLTHSPKALDMSLEITVK